MKIIGTGVDIIENSRIKKSILNNSFLNRVFTNKEILISEKMKNKSSYFAKRFAAKEAIKKALSSYKESANQSFKSIEVLNSKSGKPYVVSQTNEDINISISHDGNYAVAFCIIDK